MTLPTETMPRSHTPGAFAADGVLVRISLKPTTMLISTLREFVYALTSHVLGDVEMASRIGLALHELLENVVKYSVDGVANISVELSDSGGVVVAVKSRSGAAQATALQSALAEIAAASDPVAFYQMALRRSAARATGSGLGLARIWAEGEMTLSGEFDGDLVAIAARAHRSVR